MPRIKAINASLCDQYFILFDKFIPFSSNLYSGGIQVEIIFRNLIQNIHKLDIF